MKVQVKNLISVLWSFVRFGILKLWMPGALSVSPVERVSPNVMVDLTRDAKLVLGRRVRIHRGTKISARCGGVLEIGDNVAINQNCGIYATHRVIIGAGCEFGPGVLIYDHDHDFRAPGGLKAGKFKTAPVVIGENVWIGANAVILRGTTIGDNSVIGAGTIVSGDIPANCIMTQKRETVIREITPEN